MSGNFQPGIHPDADQLSVFVEGAASAREHKRMLTHLSQCRECRRAVFLMQPQEETQAATATPAQGWVWRRLLLSVGLPAVALACGLIAVLSYIRPRGGTPEIPHQSASGRQPGIQLPATTVAPAINSEAVARSGRSKKSFDGIAAANTSRQANYAANRSNLPRSEGHPIAANAGAPQVTAAVPSASAPGSEDATAPQSISPGSESGSPLNGQDVANLKQGSVPEAQAAASRNSVAEKKDLPQLLINGQDVTLAGVSGQIMDRSGAIIAGATVTLRDPSGKTRQTTTGTDGSFRLTELPAGKYELIATANGFKTNTQSIELQPSELAMVRPLLDVGTASETVEVTGGNSAIQVQTESANVSGAVTEKEATNLAVNGRNFSQLLTLQPGAVTVSHGKRFLSLDDAGNLLLSLDKGKKWKKVNPQWTGKAVRIELAPAAANGAAFHMTTDAGAIWTSKDGIHWHQQ